MVGFDKWKPATLAAIGASRDGHFVAAQLQDRGSSQEEAATLAKCTCGAVLPSRQHLTWACPTMEERRQRLMLEEPTCNAEQKLLVRSTSVPFKGRQRSKQLVSVFHAIAVEMRRIAADAGGKVLVATDGGSEGKHHEERWGSYGVALHDPQVQEPLKFEGPVIGIDGTPLCGEQYGANVALAAARLAEVEIHVIIDNLTCLRGVKSILAGARGPTELPGRWEVTRQLAEGKGHKADWVPSHGKSKEWLPPDGSEETASLWRKLNKAADAAAGSALRKLKEEWVHFAYEREMAAEWSDRAMAVQAEASNKLLELHELENERQFKHSAPGRIKTWVATDRAPFCGNKVLSQELAYSKCIGTVPKGQKVLAERVGNWLRLYRAEGYIRVRTRYGPLMKLCEEESEESAQVQPLQPAAPLAAPSSHPNARNGPTASSQLVMSQPPTEMAADEMENGPPPCSAADQVESQPRLTEEALQHWRMTLDPLSDSSSDHSSSFMVSDR